MHLVTSKEYLHQFHHHFIITVKQSFNILELLNTNRYIRGTPILQNISALYRTLTLYNLISNQIIVLINMFMSWKQIFL